MVRINFWSLPLSATALRAALILLVTSILRRSGHPRCWRSNHPYGRRDRGSPQDRPTGRTPAVRWQSYLRLGVARGGLNRANDLKSETAPTHTPLMGLSQGKSG